jgi:hypothetical protein
MVQFACQLVEISHAQWMYRNFTLHHYAKGYLQQQTEQDIGREVDLLADTRLLNLPMECRYLLELPQRPSMSLSSVHNAYWILALKAAKAACSREEREYAQKSTRAQRKEHRISRNLLDGVETSLCRHLLTDIPSRKCKHTTKKPTKRPRRVFQAQRQHKNIVTIIVPKRVRQCFEK